MLPEFPHLHGIFRFSGVATIGGLSVAELRYLLFVLTCVVLTALSPVYSEDGRSGVNAIASSERAANDHALPPARYSTMEISGLTDPDHIRVVSHCNKQITELTQQGRYAEALGPAYKVLDITQQDLGPESLEVASALNNIGWLEQSRGDYVKARQQFNRSLKIIEAALGPDNPKIAYCLNNLASLSYFQGDYDTALPLYQRARAISEKSFGSEDPVVAAIIKSIAGVLDAQGKKDEALAAYEKALRINEKALPADSADVADSLNDYAYALQDRNRTAEAIPLLERALTIREKTVGPDHPSVAEALNNLAMVYRNKQEFDRAKALLDRALIICRNTLGPEHLDVANLLNNRADVARMRNDLPAAQEDILKAAEIIDLHIKRVLPALSFAEQQAFIDSRIPGEVDRLLIACRQGESLSRAYSLIFRWKGLLIDSLKKQVVIARLSEDERYKTRVDRLQKVRAEIAGWYLAAGTVPYQQWKKKNDELTADKELIERELADAAKSTLIADEMAGGDLKTLQQRLKPDECIVDVYLYHFATPNGAIEQHYAAVVTGSIASGAAPVLVDLGRSAAVNVAVMAWREDVRTNEQAQSSWQELRRIAWSPLKAALPAGVERVWICPDSDLSQIPLQLLPEVDGRNMSPLISQLDSPRELFHMKAASNNSPPANAGDRPLLLLLGNAAFDSDKVFPAHSGNLEKQLMAFSELPETARELKDIAAVAAGQGFATAVLTGAEATKKALLDKLPLASYAHLATHGFFFSQKAFDLFRANAQAGEAGLSEPNASGSENGGSAPRRNPLVESGIALSGANLKIPGSSLNPGLLTAEELIGVDLSRCKLIALSACDTGRGEEIAGQGVMGLRASLIASGARSVIMSLWKVPDEATAKLMEILYHNLWEKHLPAARALCDAQLETAKLYRQPVNWAGWALVGQGW